MKKWALFLMVAALLAAPMLACGFPLPAGNVTMRTAKAVCAEGEASASCQERQDAYQLMSKLQSAAIPDLAMSMAIDTEGQQDTIDVTGSFEYQVVDSNEGLGANIRAQLNQGEMTSLDGDQSLSNTEFVVIGTKGYTSQDDGKTWTYEELNDTTMLGLGLILGLGGPTGNTLDLYADPAIFTVTTGADATYDGQTMHVQTLTVDLSNLMTESEALTAMLKEAFAATSSLGLSEDQLGMTTEQFVAMLAVPGVADQLLQALEGTALSTTLYIGADDGYIHYVEESMAFNFVPDPSTPPMVMSYYLTGHVTQHNEPMVITAPTDATEGGGLFGQGGGLFGSSGGNSGNSGTGAN